MGSQLLQNTEIIKNKLTYYFGKSEENKDLSCIYLAVQEISQNFIFYLIQRARRITLLKGLRTLVLSYNAKA